MQIISAERICNLCFACCLLFHENTIRAMVILVGTLFPTVVPQLALGGLQVGEKDLLSATSIGGQKEEKELPSGAYCC